MSFFSSIWIIGLCLLLSCCAWDKAPGQSIAGDMAPATDLPADAHFNYGAGRGDFLFLELNLHDGNKLLFVLDTGSSYTILDKTFRSTLGNRLRSNWLRSNYGLILCQHYKSPGLYLGKTRLLTGKEVGTFDFRAKTQPFHGRPVMGILGIDCLRHYCFQLDFKSAVIHFLPPDVRIKAQDGKCFKLHYNSDGWPMIDHNLNGISERTVIDTGNITDGELRKPFMAWLASRFFTSRNGGSQATGAFDGEKYPDLAWGASRFNENGIGLRFLARHKVTLDLQNGWVCFQRESLGPLTNTVSSSNLWPPPSLSWWDVKSFDANAQDQAGQLAQSIMKPPNLRPANPIPDIVSSTYGQSWYHPQPVRVETPLADLATAQIPPQDFHMDIDSHLSLAKSNVVFNFKCSASQNKPHLPLSEHGTIFLLHDYNDQKECMIPWACLLSQAGFRTILVDLRGHGESTGQTISYGPYEVADLKQVLDFYSKQHPSDKIGVLGVGYGAYLALNWAARDSRISALAAIAPYNKMDQVLARMAKRSGQPLASNVVRQASALVAARLGINWNDWSGAAAARRIAVPTLLVGAGLDDLCPANELPELRQIASTKSKVVVVPAATHEIIGYCFHELAGPIKDWFDKTLASPAHNSYIMSRGEQRSTSLGDSKAAYDGIWRGFSFPPPSR